MFFQRAVPVLLAACAGKHVALGPVVLSGGQINPAQFEDSKAVAQRRILLDHAEDVRDQRRLQAHVVFGARVGHFQGRGRLEAERLEPGFVEPTIIVDFGKTVRLGEEAPGLMLRA